MYRTGFANLPLHGGKAPSWLTVRMRKLAKEIANIMIEEQGTTKFIQRLSDPYWFQAFGCVLAYDWHSSGVTTVVTGILKGAISLEDTRHRCMRGERQNIKENSKRHSYGRRKIRIFRRDHKDTNLRKQNGCQS